MLEGITKCQQSSKSFYKLSILVPSWNNLTYLKLCVKSIINNSSTDVQIVVIINDGGDGTLDWIKTQKEIDFIHSSVNIGICYGLNIARSLIKSNYIVYVNDDMYLLPDWDNVLIKEIENINGKEFMLSCTMIEPLNTGNPCVIVKNYGCDVESFKENLLLSEYSGLFINDWNGSTWPPTLVHLDLWDLVGGLSTEFSPGMYSDPDFSKKLFEAGVKIFKGKGNSLVYHFGSKSTKRINKNNGRKTFLLKWGITSNTFTRECLKLGKSFSDAKPNSNLSARTKLINRIKRILNC